MESFKPQGPAPITGRASGPAHRLSKAPRRLSVTVPGALFSRLETASTQQGRSISNLCAYLLEVICNQLEL